MYLSQYRDSTPAFTIKAFKGVPLIHAVLDSRSLERPDGQKYCVCQKIFGFDNRRMCGLTIDTD